jgi:hypothetical protein
VEKARTQARARHFPHRRAGIGLARPIGAAVFGWWRQDVPRDCKYVARVKADQSEFSALFEAADTCAKGSDRWAEIQPGYMAFHFATNIAHFNFCTYVARRGLELITANEAPLSIHMPICLDVERWRISRSAEVSAFLGDSDKPAARTRRQLLAVRTHLKPVDVYTYLKARFGEPNGFQNFLRKDDSDNLVHWDFNLKAGKEDVYIVGTSREVHIIVSEQLSDEQWKQLILAIKSDYQRIAAEKSTILKSLEKYVLFQNKYIALADLCAELHSRILDAPPPVAVIEPNENKESLEAYREAVNQQAKRIEQLFGDCLKLRLLMPIMAEAYINMLILAFCKSTIRDDKAQYESFQRAGIMDRLSLLHENCDGFQRPVDKSLSGYGHFGRTMSKRNFALHGNVDPVSEQIEVVYFDKRRPLFVNPGHNIGLLFQQIEKQADPAGLVKEYEELHGFLAEVAGCLSPSHRAFFDEVISDAYPGFELMKRRPTRLFPDHTVWFAVQGTRYDDQLDVHW